MLIAEEAVFCSVSFIYGMCTGSFLNVVIYRLPKGISVISGRSSCRDCGSQLKAYELLPVISYALLRGKCAHCGSSISLRYPVVELISGLAAAASYLAYGISVRALLLFMIAAILIAVAFIDMDTMTIPDSLVVSAVPISLILVLMDSALTLASAAAGSLSVSFFMIVMNRIVPDSFGGGDIKLMAVCGFFLGWQNALLSFFIAVFTGGTFAVWLIASRRSGRGSHMAFGPFLCLGIFVSMIMGTRIVESYINMLKF